MSFVTTAKAKSNLANQPELGGYAECLLPPHSEATFRQIADVHSLATVSEKTAGIPTKGRVWPKLN